MNVSILAAALIIGLGAAVSPAAFAGHEPIRSSATVSRQDPDLIERAKRLVEQLRAGEFEQATTSWDSTMAVHLPAAKLAEAWKQLTAQVGTFKSAGAASVVEQGPARVVLIPLTFEQAELVAQIAYDGQNKVSGLFFTPKT